MGLQVKPHSIEAFLSEKASRFLADEFPPYLVVFYSHIAWNELYNTINPSPGSAKPATSNLRSIPKTSDSKKGIESVAPIPKAIDYFTKGLEGETFYIDIEKPVEENSDLTKMPKDFGSTSIPPASLSSIHTKGVDRNEIIVKEKNRFVLVKKPDVDETFKSIEF